MPLCFYDLLKNCVVRSLCGDEQILACNLENTFTLGTFIIQTSNHFIIVSPF